MHLRLEDKVKQVISIPAYYKKFVDQNAELKPKIPIPCKMHNEKHGKSLSWNPDADRLSCRGKCHFSGDVIDLHQRWTHLRDREEATLSLAIMFNIGKDKTELVRRKENYSRLLIDKVGYLNKAESMLKTIDDYIELDYLMSKNKMTSEIIEDLKDFIQARGGEINEARY